MEHPQQEQEAPGQDQENPEMWDGFGYVDYEAGNGNEIQGMIPPAAVFEQIEENEENAGVGQMYDQNIGHQHQGHEWQNGRQVHGNNQQMPQQNDLGVQ